MAQTLFKLNPKTISAIKTPGRHSDGGGLYLSVSKSGARSWVFFYKLDGRQREMGLGSANAVSLAAAREKAAAARGDLANRIDPLDKRNEQRAKPKAKTFGEVAEEYIAAHRHEWRNAKHGDQWSNTLKTHAAGLWETPIDDIDTDDVVATLDPIWTKIPETARRVRGRVETVLDAARVRKLRTGENPARWRGHLDKLLAKGQKLSRGHHAAMDYSQVPAFVATLGATNAMSATALEFTILTAARSGEVRGATRDEFDLEKKIWTIPAKRMKAGREHRVPLSVRAIAIVEKLTEAKTGDFVFAGQRGDKPLSVMAMDMTLRRMGIDNATVHGFRSAFRDWVGNETHFAREVAEAALAHVVGDKAEQAYRRSDALEKRRLLMEAWATYCETPPSEGKVVAFGRKAS